jgi:hypothetical protein
MYIMFCFFHCFMITLILFLKLSTVVELNGAELFFLQMLQGQQKIVDCFSSLEQHSQDMDIRFRVSFFGCFCVPLNFVACHKVCFMLYSLAVHTFCHILLW